MLIDNSFRPDKRFRYTPDPLSYDIYIYSGNYVSTLTAPSESPEVIVLTEDNNYTGHILTKEKHGCAAEKRGYYSMRNYGRIYYKTPSSISLRVQFIKVFPTLM